MGIYLLIAGVLHGIDQRGVSRARPDRDHCGIGMVIGRGRLSLFRRRCRPVEDGDELVELATFGVMGFACLPCLGLIQEIAGAGGLLLVGLGGAFYAIGVGPFILAGQHPGWHVVWHLFVMAGAVTHWFCVYLYVVPQLMVRNF